MHADCRGPDQFAPFDRLTKPIDTIQSHVSVGDAQLIVCNPAGSVQLTSNGRNWHYGTPRAPLFLKMIVMVNDLEFQRSKWAVGLIELGS